VFLGCRRPGIVVRLRIDGRSIILVERRFSLSRPRSLTWNESRYGGATNAVFGVTLAVLRASIFHCMCTPSDGAEEPVWKGAPRAVIGSGIFDYAQHRRGKKSCHLTLKFVKCPEFATAQAELGAKCPRSGCLYGKGRVEWSRNGACLNRIL
jgi:hypothetical protein